MNPVDLHSIQPKPERNFIHFVVDLLLAHKQNHVDKQAVLYRTLHDFPDPCYVEAELATRQSEIFPHLCVNSCVPIETSPAVLFLLYFEWSLAAGCLPSHVEASSVSLDPLTFPL